MFAIPTVRRFGDINQPLSNTFASDNNSSNDKTSSVITLKAAQAPTILGTTSLTNQSETARASIRLKTPSINKILKNVTPQQSASSSDIKKLSDKITELESKTDNIITDVVSNDGTYVSDIVIDGNKINVNKTDTLYIPVKMGSSERITDTAEIWIVR